MHAVTLTGDRAQHAAILRNPHRINAQWLVRLRWWAAGGQLAVIGIVHWLVGIALPLSTLGLIIATGLILNGFCAWWLRQRAVLSELFSTALIAIDIALLTALLAFSGGPSNPFNFLYLVYIALAAVVLRPAASWTLLLLSLACFASLFLLPQQSMGDHSHNPFMHMHLQGMWVAFAVAAVFILYFVRRVTRALAEHEQHAREVGSRNEKLAALATLAGGAAHELATPLSVIATVAKELERQLQQHGSSADVVEDAQLVRSQVERCRTILQQMSADAGAAMGEAMHHVSIAALLDTTLREFAAAERVDCRVDVSASDVTLSLPVENFARVVRGLLSNASDASAPEQRIELTVSADPTHCLFVVRDHGQGMSAARLARVGEPFFTDKAPGLGMGLGLFLAHAVIERLRGELTLASAPNEGTVATIALPVGD